VVFFRFVEMHYANAVFVRRSLGDFGERISAVGASFFFLASPAMLICNLCERLFGNRVFWMSPLTALGYAPSFGKVVVAAIIAFALGYAFLWRRAVILEERYCALRDGNRLLLLVGFLLSLTMMMACIFSEWFFLESLVVIVLVLFLQEAAYWHFAKKGPA
jgi:hypothetical protein